MTEILFRVVKEWDVVSVKLTPEGERRIKKCEEECLCTACLLPIKPGQKSVRGQHQTPCYASTMRKIREKRVSDKQLMRDGKLKPAGKPGPRPINDYTQELAEY